LQVQGGPEAGGYRKKGRCQQKTVVYLVTEGKKKRVALPLGEKPSATTGLGKYVEEKVLVSIVSTEGGSNLLFAKMHCKGTRLTDSGKDPVKAENLGEKRIAQKGKNNTDRL